ncbi:DinB family protein [Flavitalea flava]
MKTIFDKTTREELIARINQLPVNSKAQWGKMNIYQMLKHCTLYEEMLLGKMSVKRMFLGRIFGKVALKDLIGDANPIKQNLPTIPEIKVKEDKGDISKEKQHWIALIQEHAHSSNTEYIHAFSGIVTKEQSGYLAYKHTDHHLRQFNS